METIWSRLSWPQVVALGVLVLGVVSILVAVPLDKLTAIPWDGVIGVVLVLAGGGASAALAPMLRPRGSAPPSDIRERRTDPPSRTAGFAESDLMVTILAWAVGGCIALAVQGCGAGGISAAVLAAKPAIDVACHVARRSCDFVSTACTAIGSGETAGGDAP